MTDDEKLIYGRLYASARLLFIALELLDSCDDECGGLVEHDEVTREIEVAMSHQAREAAWDAARRLDELATRIRDHAPLDAPHPLPRHSARAPHPTRGST